MNYISSMLPVLLPIALFVVTLIIIFTLRASDKRSKSLSNVKKLLDIYKGNIEAADNSFKQYATELEQTVSKKDAEVKSFREGLVKLNPGPVAQLASNAAQQFQSCIAQVGFRLPRAASVCDVHGKAGVQVNANRACRNLGLRRDSQSQQGRYQCPAFHFDSIFSVFSVVVLSTGREKAMPWPSVVSPLSL